jgi:hypothetical protein
VAATAASTLSDKPRWEKDIELLGASGRNRRLDSQIKAAAINPGTARKFARDFRKRRQAAYSRYRVSIPGRIKPEHRGELDKVNGAGAASVEKA